MNFTCPVSISGSIIGTGLSSLRSDGDITVDSTYITVDTKENSIAGGSIIGVGDNWTGSGGPKRGSISVSGGTITIKNLKDIYGCVIGVGRSDKDMEAYVENITADGVEINIDKVTNVTTEPDYPLGVVIGVGPGGSYCDVIEIKNFKGISIDTIDGSSPVQPFIGSCNGSNVLTNIKINLSGNESQDSFLSNITLTQNGQDCTFPDGCVKVGCVGSEEGQSSKVIWVAPTGTASTN